MTPVKPLTVVTKIGTARRYDGKEIESMSLMGPAEYYWFHEDCVTLADAERYARERVEEALENVRRFYAGEEREFPQNHGAFYLETQADLVLKERIDQLERRVKELERNDLV